MKFIEFSVKREQILTNLGERKGKDNYEKLPEGVNKCLEIDSLDELDISDEFLKTEIKIP